VSSEPADVYQGVCDLVREVVENDAQGIFEDPTVHQLGDKERQARTKMALMVEPFVVRKTIKQTVMTTVYGVTFIGAKKQIYERLMDHAYPGGPLEVRTIRFCLRVLNFYERLIRDLPEFGLVHRRSLKMTCTTPQGTSLR